MRPAPDQERAMELVKAQTLTGTVVGRHPPIPRWLLASMAVSSILYAIVNLHRPVGILGTAGFDDALFFTHGLSILEGHWLGPYSQMTLAKGPGYPLFLAANALIGLPITLTQSLLYIAACLLLGSTVFRLCGLSVVAFAAFLVLEWQPYIPPIRIIRDDVCAAQALLVLGCFTRALLVEERQSRRLVWAIGGGVLAGWLWMTREDGIWLAPGLALLLGLHLLRSRRIQRILPLTATPTLAFAASTLVTLGTVASINLAVYGTFSIVDIKSSSYKNALDTLQSVHVGEPVAFVPVPEKVRHAIDQVSPAFASLDPYFNGPGLGWQLPGCKIYPSTCNDIAGGWFIWALRDSVASQGHYSSPTRAAAFYRSLTKQIRSACAEGKLTCQGGTIPFIPEMTPGQWKRLWPDIAKITRLATMQLPLWQAPPSDGNEAQINQAMALLNNPLHTLTVTERDKVLVSGWFLARPGDWVLIRCNDQSGAYFIPVERLPSPDVADYFHEPTAVAQRFSEELPSREGCGIGPTGATAGGQFRSFATLQLGPNNLAGSELYLDNIAPSYGPAPGRTGERIISALHRLYAVVMPAATIVALLMYLAYTVRLLARWRLSDITPLYILACAVWVLVLARAAILILVDLSSFPAVNPLYFTAGPPLTGLGVVICLALPWDRARRVLT